MTNSERIPETVLQRLRRPLRPLLLHMLEDFMFP
jgi:hypothetical protein